MIIYCRSLRPATFATGRAAVGSPSVRSVPPLGPNRLARPQDKLHRVASGSGSGVEYNPLDSSPAWYANDKLKRPRQKEWSAVTRKDADGNARADWVLPA